MIRHHSPRHKFIYILSLCPQSTGEIGTKLSPGSALCILEARIIDKIDRSTPPGDSIEICSVLHVGLDRSYTHPHDSVKCRSSSFNQYAFFSGGLGGLALIVKRHVL